MLFGSGSGLRCGGGCGDNLIQVFHDNGLALTLLNLQRALGAILTLTAVGLLTYRWLNATRPQRREVTWVLLAGNLTLLALTVTVVDDLLGNPLNSGPAKVWFLTLALVPIAVLVTFARRRLARGSVAGLVVRLGAPTGRGSPRRAGSSGRSLARTRVLVPGRGPVCDRGRPPGDKPDADSARGSTCVNATGPRSRCCCTIPRSNTTRTRPVGMRRRGPRARERAASGRVRARLVELGGSRGRLARRQMPSAAGSSATFTMDAATAGLDRDVARAARVQAGPGPGRKRPRSYAKPGPP